MADAPDWYAPETDTTAVVPAQAAAPSTVTSSASPDWYAPEPAVAPVADNSKQAFPYDDPKYNYGSVLPFRTEANAADQKTASQSGGVLPFLWNHLAVPEFIREPMRDAIAGGQQATGETDQYGSQNGLTALLALNGGGTLGGLRVGSAAARAAETNPAIARAATQTSRFEQTPIGQYQAPADAAVSAMGSGASPAQIGQTVMDKAATFLKQEKAKRGAALDAVEAQASSGVPVAPPGAIRDGTGALTPDGVAFVNAHSGQSASSAAPPEGMVPPAANPKIARLAQLQSDRQAANAGLPAAGDPSRSFASIAAGPSDVAPIPTRAELPATLETLTKPSEGPPKPAIFGQLQKQLNESNGTLPYAETKAWRSRVGEAIDGAQGGEGTGQLKQLYKSLSTDMEGHLKTNGGDAAVTAFRNANEGYADLQDFVKNRLGNLTSGSMTPEGVYSSLAANPAQSATRLSDLVEKGVLNQGDVGTIARSWLSRAGTNAEGHYDPVQLTRSVTQLQKDSPEAYDLLFRQGGRGPAFDAGMAQANRLAAVQSSVARANPPSPGAMDTVKKAAKGLAMATGMSHIPLVGPVGGELVGGLLGIGEGAAKGGAGNPLYALPKVPFSATGYLKALQARAAAGGATTGRAALRSGALVQPTGGQ